MTDKVCTHYIVFGMEEIKANNSCHFINLIYGFKKIAKTKTITTTTTTTTIIIIIIIINLDKILQQQTENVLGSSTKDFH